MGHENTNIQLKHLLYKINSSRSSTSSTASKYINNNNVEILFATSLA
jgi:hypothetical protein